MNFETVIGLEVHVELNTNSKIFSPTSAHFGNDQNANTNVIDWSFPGVLPVLNKGVVNAGIKAALALNMDIHKKMHFDRKNYFYPRQSQSLPNFSVWWANRLQRMDWSWARRRYD